MKTNWTKWCANDGEVTAKYIAQREWDSYMLFYARIRFLRGGTFEVMVEDFELSSVEEDGENRVFETLEEAVNYLSSIDCEKYVDEWWKRENEYQRRLDVQESKEL